LVQLNFYGHHWRGPPRGGAALDAFLAEWRRSPVDSEVCLFVRGMPDRAGYEALLDAALERRVHLRVGLGDNPHLFAHGRSADMVEHAVELAGRRGLTPATPADLRARLHIPAFEGELS
jgi:hypothetical protein